MKRYLVSALTIAFIAAAAFGREPSRPPGPIPPGAKTLVAQDWNLNTQYAQYYDGQWLGIHFASDGNCYFADSSHSRRGAGFFKYDPRANQITQICADITIICHEDPTKTPAQGKIHSPMVESDGWLYFTTHLANYWDSAQEAYTGGHLVGYEIATQKFRDYGVMRPRYSSYAGVNVDPVNKKAYVFVTPFAESDKQREGRPHMYRVDLVSGEKTDLGSLGFKKGGTSYHFFIDPKGDCWFALSGTSGNLYRAHPDSSKVDVWENALPLRSGPAADVIGGRQDDRWWHWGQATPDGKKFLFTISGGGALWTFDPSKAPNWKQAFQQFAFIGPNDLGMAMTKDRIYFIQRAKRQRGVKADDNHLFSTSLDPKNRAIIDHGLIVDKDGRRAWRLQSMAADDAGRVYMTGDWYVKEGEKGLLRYQGERGRDEFEEQIRGQFFAVVDVSKDLAVPPPEPTAGEKLQRLDPRAVPSLQPSAAVREKVEKGQAAAP